MRKIAMLGTAPSTRSLVPQNDEWELWTQADYWADLKKVDRWFELAPMQKLVAEFPDYLNYLKAATFPVYMRDHFPEIPNSTPLPFEKYEQQFGREFMTATLCWMMAAALDEHMEGNTVECIGLWGYDMAMDSEYVHQRPGIKHLAWICEHHLPALGHEPIRVFVPKGSDLLVAPIPYPFAEDDPMVAKIRARKRDLTRRVEHTQQQRAQLEAQLGQLNTAIQYLNGALEDVNYFDQMACGTKLPAA